MATHLDRLEASLSHLSKLCSGGGVGQSHPTPLDKLEDRLHHLARLVLPAGGGILHDSNGEEISLEMLFGVWSIWSNELTARQFYLFNTIASLMMTHYRKDEIPSQIAMAHNRPCKWPTIAMESLNEYPQHWEQITEYPQYWEQITEYPQHWNDSSLFLFYKFCIYPMVQRYWADQSYEADQSYAIMEQQENLVQVVKSDYLSWISSLQSFMRNKYPSDATMKEHDMLRFDKIEKDMTVLFARKIDEDAHSNTFNGQPASHGSLPFFHRAVPAIALLHQLYELGGGKPFYLVGSFGAAISRYVAAKPPKQEQDENLSREELFLFVALWVCRGNAIDIQLHLEKHSDMKSVVEAIVQGAKDCTKTYLESFHKGVEIVYHTKPIINVGEVTRVFVCDKKFGSHKLMHILPVCAENHKKDHRYVTILNSLFSDTAIVGHYLPNSRLLQLPLGCHTARGEYMVVNSCMLRRRVTLLHHESSNDNSIYNLKRDTHFISKKFSPLICKACNMEVPYLDDGPDPVYNLKYHIAENKYVRDRVWRQCSRCELDVYGTATLEHSANKGDLQGNWYEKWQRLENKWLEKREENSVGPDELAVWVTEVYNSQIEYLDNDNEGFQTFINGV